MIPNVVLGASAISCGSRNLEENLDFLLAGSPAVVPGSVFLGPHEVRVHGRIPDSEIDSLINGFGVPPKARKFFDRPSALGFFCVSGLAGSMTSLPEETALFVATGPTNARLEVFSEWERMRTGAEPYPSLMASETIKLLPNLIMSNLSMNLGIRGENSLFCGGAQAGAAALEAALEVLGSPGAELAAVLSVSTPLEYFNVDAYRRFLPDRTRAPHLVDAAAALLIAPGAGARDGNGNRRTSHPIPDGHVPLGSILGVRRFKVSADLLSSLTHGTTSFPSAALANISEFPFEIAGYPSVDHGFSSVVVQPSRFGQTLSAAEPLGCLAAMRSLKGKGPTARGVSISIDPFGNGSAIEVEGPDGPAC